MARKTLYQQVVATGEKYLGPAGERFMRRQIDTHLGIAPEKLTAENIASLIDWASLAFAMLTEDTSQREAFTHDLLALTNTSKGRATHVKANQ